MINRNCRLLALLFVLALLLGSVSHSLSARDLTSLQAEVWIDLEPMGINGPNPDISREDSIHALLDEALAIFSGMIYGFEFEYRPSDIARKVDEKFTITPIAMIPWGDPGLEYRESRNDENSVYLRVRYLPKEMELVRLEAWVSAQMQDSAGTGVASYFEGTPARLKSIMEACKSAIRSCARGLSHNKPAWVVGKLVLSDIPRTVVIAGQFRTDVHVRIDMQEIFGYKTY